MRSPSTRSRASSSPRGVWRRRVCVRHPSRELRQLLLYTGLAEVCGLTLELERQAEQREQRLRVEEEGELDDPAVEISSTCSAHGS